MSEHNNDNRIRNNHNENDLWSFWDKEVWQKVSEFEGMLIPGLEIKAFDYGAEEETEAWLAE